MENKQEELLERLRGIEDAFMAIVTEAEYWNRDQLKDLPPVIKPPIDMGRLIRANEWIEHAVMLAERAIRGR